MTIASMAMYPFATTRPDYDRLWDAIRARLPFDAPPLDWDVVPDDACRRPDVLVGQMCGWPLATQLRTSVRVIGTFDCDVPGAHDGTYCSLLVTKGQATLPEIWSRHPLRVVANSADSLSGWISLRAAADVAGAAFDTVEWTGAHAVSVEALRDGRADLAAIDSVSWTHLDQTGLTVVGQGPRIPCVPLITAGTTSDEVLAALRDAFAGAVADPALADTCRSLRIRGFLPCDLDHYEGVTALAQLG